VKPKLVRGSGGIFDVTLDGKVIYSKHKTGRFPSPGEVLAMLKAKPKDGTADGRR
jgi:selT/selW/selH-like putative selenoprotein